MSQSHPSLSALTTDQLSTTHGPSSVLASVKNFPAQAALAAVTRPSWDLSPLALVLALLTCCQVTIRQGSITSQPTRRSLGPAAIAPNKFSSVPAPFSSQVRALRCLGQDRKLESSTGVGRKESTWRPQLPQGLMDPSSRQDSPGGIPPTRKGARSEAVKTKQQEQAE